MSAGVENAVGAHAAPVFVRPRTLAEALDKLAEGVAKGARPVLLAGGTDWMVERHLAGAHDPPPAVMDLTGLEELKHVARGRDAQGRTTYEIGAGVPYLTFRRDAALAREVPLLAAMAREVGAVQIQARGTLGGNLATGSPAADGVCALAGLGASVELASAARGRREVPLAGFYTGYKRTVLAPDELVTAVRFAAPGAHWYWRKVGTRMAQSISKVALAATAVVQGGRVREAHLGMASVGPTTAFLPSVRTALLGAPLEQVTGEALREALARDIAPLDDVRSTREYRLHAAERVVGLFVESLREAPRV